MDEKDFKIMLKRTEAAERVASVRGAWGFRAAQMEESRRQILENVASSGGMIVAENWDPFEGISIRLRFYDGGGLSEFYYDLQTVTGPIQVERVAPPGNLPTAFSEVLIWIKPDKSR